MTHIDIYGIVSCAMTDKERLDLAIRLIERCDTLRTTVANRALLVVTADAVLIAGLTFLLSIVLSSGTHFAAVPRTIVLSVSAISLVSLALSVVFATFAVAFVWRKGRDATGMKDTPPNLFFHARDTAEHFGNASQFIEVFESTSVSTMTAYALGELLLATKSHHQRYEDMRRSMRLLAIAAVAFVIAVTLLLAQIALM